MFYLILQQIHLIIGKAFGIEIMGLEQVEMTLML